MIDDNNNHRSSKVLTLGSLFDGIGAFPLAATYFGIKPIWASEILPNGISVTKRHFPEMEHLGDITKLNGGEIPPVDLLTFGSPCQSWSVAGSRTGFDGKSGLFSEAIRIIREMRCATNGNYPQITIFENVPGLLSNRGGLDYKAVLEAFCETEIPMPDSGKWANAGMVRGGGIDFAWVIKDSQHFRTAQRRRRLLAVRDFTGRRAAEILFVCESLSGYFAARELARKRVAAFAESGVGSESSGINGSVAGTLDANYGKGAGMRCGIERDVVLCAASGQSNAEILHDASPTLTSNSEQPIVCANGGSMVVAFMAGQAKNARSIAYSETVSPTLKGSASGLNQTPSVLCVANAQVDAIAAAKEELAPTLTLHHETPYICAEQMAYGICAKHSNSMLSDNPDSGVYEAETCRTLDQTCCNPACNQGGIAIVEPQVLAINQNPLGELRASDIAYTLGTNANATGRNAPLIAFAQNQRNEVRDLNGVAGCIAAEPGMKQQTYVAQPISQRSNNCLTPWDTQDSRVFTPNSVAPTMAGADLGGGRRPCGVVLTETDQTYNCPTCAPDAYGFDMQQITSKTNRSSLKPVQPSLCAAGNPHVVEVHPDIAGTLLASGAGMSRTAGHGGETDLAVVYPSFCLQGNMIGRKDENGPRGGGVNEEIAYSMTATDRHGVAYSMTSGNYASSVDGTAAALDGGSEPLATAVDCRNLYETAELSGTLAAKETGGYSLNYVNPVRTGYVIRRLTPTECEKLMSMDEGYTAYGHDGRQISDSARYSLLGNSIVVNVIAYIMQNIAEMLGGESQCRNK
ncbi:DNA methyltransferase [Clostridia bacterium]|nr:DNA methyltransferase [Clostridia bacterium]